MKTEGGKESVIHTQMVITIFEDGRTYLFGNTDGVNATDMELINSVRETMDRLYSDSDGRTDAISATREEANSA